MKKDKGLNKRKLLNENRSGMQNNYIAPKGYKNPFRISDGKMVIGRYKGWKLSKINDFDYLKWMHDNVQMDELQKSILTKHLKHNGY